MVEGEQQGPVLVETFFGSRNCCETTKKFTLSTLVVR